MAYSDSLELGIDEFVPRVNFPGMPKPRPKKPKLAVDINRDFVVAKELIIQPEGPFRLGDFLKQNFANQQWEEFRAAVAFIKRSGTKHIRHDLADFARRAKVKMTAGIDADGTSIEGLTDLLEAVDHCGEIWIFHNANPSTFHPKIYLFKNQFAAEIVIGSANLTEGGLYTNYEAGMKITLDLNNADDAVFLAVIETKLDQWAHLQDGLCYPLSREFLRQLIDQKHTPNEAQSWENKDGFYDKKNKSLFKKISIPQAPKIRPEFDDFPKSPDQRKKQKLAIERPDVASIQMGQYQAFVMTLQRTDVGTGQTTQGTSRRSPEIFIPLAARNADPEFWGWPNQFTEDSAKLGKMDRLGVKMRIGVCVYNINMMTWPDKHDFRLRSEHLRSAGELGDILYIERSDGQSSFDYYRHTA